MLGIQPWSKNHWKHSRSRKSLWCCSSWLGNAASAHQTGPRRQAWLARGGSLRRDHANPTVYLDGEIVEENGKYVHPELAKLVKDM